MMMVARRAALAGLAGLVAVPTLARAQIISRGAGRLVVFSATATGATTEITTTDPSGMDAFGTVTIDVNVGAGLGASGAFTAPIAGSYLLSYQTSFQVTSSTMTMGLRKNGSTYLAQRLMGAVGYAPMACQAILDLAQGDVIEPIYVSGAASGNYVVNSGYGTFCGHLIG